jgi:hypothetical protein
MTTSPPEPSMVSTSVDYSYDEQQNQSKDESFPALVDESTLTYDQPEESIETNDLGHGSFQDRGKAARTKTRQKKAMLMVLCGISFAVLVGLAVVLGRRQAGNSSNSSLSADDSAGTQPPVVVVGETEPPVDGNFVPPVTNTTTPNEPASTESPNDTEESTGTVAEPTFTCEFDGVDAEVNCVNGTATVTVTICVADEVTDQFWEWIDTPDEHQEAASTSDWGWLSAGFEFSKSDLPSGSYTIGIFADGEQELDEYPLLASTEFTNVCP